MLTKSIAAGSFLLLVLLYAVGAERDATTLALSAGALAGLALTTLLLVLDLERPARFLYVLTRPNPRSWLARGSWVLVGYGGVLGIWTLLDLSGGAGRATAPLLAVGAVLAALSAGYTGWLFAQAKGRPLWMRRALWLHLVVQALVAGAALGLVLGPAGLLSAAAERASRVLLVVALAAHAAFIAAEGALAPGRREREYRLALRLLTRGPYARRRWSIGVGCGVALAGLAALALQGTWGGALAGVLALAGLWAEDDALVRAGQAAPIS
jgi:formate-dependent nitrite reductase membrane component NrfD